jgi:predicted lactoylglutathione lyase
MLAYVTVGTADLEKAKTFYNALFEELGAKITMDMGRLVTYGTEQGGAMFSVCIPFDEGEPNPGNGNMVAIGAGSKEMVDKLHARALELGGTDDGAPGSRSDFFYGAYFRDLDGNKVCFCHFG